MPAPPPKADRYYYLGFNDRWLLIFGIPLLAVLANTLFGGFDPALTGAQMLWGYVSALLYTAIYWISGRYVVLLFRRRYADRGENVRRVVLTLLGTAVIVILVNVLVNPWLNEIVSPLPKPPYFFEVAMAYTLIVMVLGGYEWVYNMAVYRRSELERERLTHENMRTQLEVLRRQMNPHFLFNSLNTLASIIPEDPHKATLFTQRLAAAYRRILEYRDRETVTLREELDCLNDYLFLLQTRFEGKLRVVFTAEVWAGACTTGADWEAAPDTPLPPELASHRIIPLAAQLLLENAVKHNVVSAGRPLKIGIQLSEDRLTVRNTLSPRSVGVNSTGWGQENLRRRYAALTDRPVNIEETATHYTVSLPLLPPTFSTPPSLKPV